MHLLVTPKVTGSSPVRVAMIIKKTYTLQLSESEVAYLSSVLASARPESPEDIELHAALHNGIVSSAHGENTLSI